MKLTKEQALDLIKVLSHYQVLAMPSVGAPTVHATLGELERFVVSGKRDDDLDARNAGPRRARDLRVLIVSGSDGCASSPARRAREKGAPDEELDEQEDDEGDKADDEGEEADGEGGKKLIPDCYEAGSDICNLTQITKATIIGSSTGASGDEVTVGLGKNNRGNCSYVCDLLINGKRVGPITHVRRLGQALHVAEGSINGRVWHNFYVPRFPKGWVDTLPLGKLIEID